MNYKNLDSLAKLTDIVFEPESWNKEDLLKFDNIIKILEEKISEEMDHNLFGKNFIEKEDIIKFYLNFIADINYNILMVNFNYSDINEDEENYEEINGIPNRIALEKYKELFQKIIDNICYYSIRNDIDLIKITKINKYLEFINFNNYHEELKELKLEKGTKKAKLKSEFTSEFAYELFHYIIDNFDNEYSDHNKLSCIYRMMVANGYIDENLRPEVFKRLLNSETYKMSTDLSLSSKDSLSKKIIEHYNSLITKFLENQK